MKLPPGFAETAMVGYGAEVTEVSKFHGVLCFALQNEFIGFSDGWSRKYLTNLYVSGNVLLYKSTHLERGLSHVDR